MTNNLQEQSIDELSMDKIKAYKETVKQNPAPSKSSTNILHKTIMRFAGKERAEDRIHADEMKKMREKLGLQSENTEELSEDAAQKFMSNAMDNIAPEHRVAARKLYNAARSKGLPHAASLNIMLNRHIKSEEVLDEMGYGQARNADMQFGASGSAQQEKKPIYKLQTKSGKTLSVHNNALDAVRARNKVGDHTTHSIVKEDVVVEQDGNFDGRKKGPIERASKEHGQVKKTPAVVTAQIAKIIAKS